MFADPILCGSLLQTLQILHGDTFSQVKTKQVFRLCFGNMPVSSIILSAQKYHEFSKSCKEKSTYMGIDTSLQCTLCPLEHYYISSSLRFTLQLVYLPGDISSSASLAEKGCYRVFQHSLVGFPWQHWLSFIQKITLLYF